MYFLKLIRRCVEDCSHAGRCDDDVAHWLTVPRIANQINAIPADYLAAYLKTFGAWDADQLGDHEQNKARLLWSACSTAKEQIVHKEPCPCTVYVGE